VLDQCGFTLCTGNVMASNPALCLSFAEWEQLFRGMVESATPQNLLKSTIYFDFRTIWGDTAAGEALHRRVVEIAAHNSLFLHTMAGNCMAIKPPLAMFRDFATEKDADGTHRLDLKVRGLTPFVDAARVLALESGILEANTPKRLRALVKAGILSDEDAGAFERSFAFVQLLRMREHQRQSAAGEPMNNRLDPEDLNPMDRRILKEAFREARRLQKKLEVRYQL
jgi:CBS domain-containing protein